MRSLVLYDSLYGNTERIAHAIVSGLKASGDVKLKHVGRASARDIEETDLLVAGSPTHGGQPKQEMKQFLDQLPDHALYNKRIAAFDTRFAIKDQGFGLRMLMKTIGFAAPRILKSLEAKGGRPAAEPKGFIVKDKEGPLKEGERDRAIAWARLISSS